MIAPLQAAEKLFSSLFVGWEYPTKSSAAKSLISGGARKQGLSRNVGVGFLFANDLDGLGKLIQCQTRIVVGILQMLIHPDPAVVGMTHRSVLVSGESVEIVVVSKFMREGAE